MKKESRIISLVIIAIVLVAVLSFSISTLMTNGSKLLGSVNGANRIPSKEGTTTYKDWQESTPIDNEYSYSTLIYTDKTRVYANISDWDHRYGVVEAGGEAYRLENMPTVPSIKIWDPDDKGQLIITDCGFDKEGNSLSAVIEFSVNNTYRKDWMLNYYYDDATGEVKAENPESHEVVTVAPLTSLSFSWVAIQNVNDNGQIVLTSQPTGNNLQPVNRYVVKYGMPLAFNLNCDNSAIDVKLTYYKTLTLKDNTIVNGVNYAKVDTSKSEIDKSITKVNSAYNDFDTTPASFATFQTLIERAAEDHELLFSANEGMKPLNGTSTLFYNKTGKQTLTANDYENTFVDQAYKGTWNFRMSEKANGIYINSDQSKNTGPLGKWQYVLYQMRDVQGKTLEQAKDYYCKYVAKCEDDGSYTGYYELGGFSYLTSAQLLTTGVEGEFAFRYEMPSGGIKFGFLSPQGYKFGDPVKSTTKSTIAVGEVGYFNVSQEIPNNNVTDSVGFHKVYPNVFSNSYKLTSYKIEDEIDKRLSVVADGITIKTQSGIDLTNYFDISVDTNNKVTAVSKSSASTFFDKLEAYGTRYTMSIPFMYIGPVDKYIEIPNKAKVTYKVGDGTPTTKETNVVKVTIGEKPVKLTYDCTTNGGKATFEPITVDQVPGTNVDLTKICSKTGNRFLGFAEQATDKTPMQSFTMPEQDTTIYGLYTTSKCDTILNSNTYKIDQKNHSVSIPNDDSDSTILKTVYSNGEISINGNTITVKCDGTTQDYTINRYWISKTGNEVIKWTAIISGTLLLAVAAVFIKIKADKKKN